MVAEWFCNISGREVGPLSSQQLRAMAAGGKLAPDDQIRQGAAGNWVLAGHVKGLFSKPRPVARPLPVATAQPDPQAPPESGQLGSGQFDIVTEPNTPGARVTGRGSFAPRAKKKKQKTTLLWLGGLVLLLAIGGVVVAIAPWKGEEQAKKQPDDEKPQKIVQEGEEPDMDAPPTGPVADAAATNTAAPVDTPPGDAVKADWVDASRSPVSRGDVEVKIQAAVVGLPRLVLPNGGLARPKSECLQIKIQLHNTSPTRKLEYTSWGMRGRPSAGVSLTDNLKNNYLLQPFRRGIPEGQLTKESIYPNKSIHDVLVFERPIDNPKLEFLRLKLPARAFGEQGVLRFKIPKTMIGAGDLPEPPKPDGEKPVRPDATPPAPGVPKPGQEENVDPKTQPGEAPEQPAEADPPNPDGDNPKPQDKPQEGDIGEIDRGIDQLGGGDGDVNQDEEYNLEDILQGNPKPPGK